MADLTLDKLMVMQDELQAKYRGKWTPILPENGHYSVLWMMEELGEVVSIFRKRGNEAIMKDPAVRQHFLEETSDVLMFFVDLLQCMEVTPEEFEQAYLAKHERNMQRNFIKEHSSYLKEEKKE